MNDQDSASIRATLDHAIEMVRYTMQNAAECYRENAIELNRPFHLLKPKVYPDGDQWCVLYGENLQEGVCGFGDTPAKAAIQFDTEWMNQRAAIAKASASDSEVKS